MAPRRSLPSAFTLALPFAIACSEKAAPADAATTADSSADPPDSAPAIPDAGGTSEAGSLAASGTVTVAACSGLDGSAENCSFHYLYDPSICGHAKPCRKAIAFYAGGEQDCTAKGYGTVMQAYATAGYVASCLQIFDTSEATGKLPYNKEADRVDTVLKAYLALVKPAWTGEHLLVSGISHGATAPVTAMARTKLDDAWKGSKTTGACFYDGIYDLRAIDDLLGTGTDAGGPCLFPVSHARIVGRYYPKDPLVHACGNKKCACDPAHAPEMDTDSITAVAPTEFAIKKWKLIECGSATPACSSDIVPAAPIKALCANLRTAAAAGYECADDSLPNSSHIVCHHTGVDRCLTWFDGIAK